MCAEIVLVKSIMSNTIHEMMDAKEEGEGVVWSTWEELLLAFAVKRYGLKDWDTVATELQNRHHHQHHRGGSGSPSSASFTAQICKDRYRNLRRRFTNNHHHHHGSSEGGGAGSSENDDESKFQSDDDEDDDEDDGGSGAGGDDAFPWLEELRKRRVAELRQEVHRYDASIRSLQIKVKTMEEERENNLKADRNDDVKQREPDLDDEEVKREGSENDKKSNNGERDTPPSKVAGKSTSVSAGDDDENVSFNESNSAGNRGAFLKTEPVEQKPDPNVKPTEAGGEDSCNDSSDRHEVYKKKKKKTQNVGRSDSDESKEGTKESSDVQSSATLLTSRRRTKKEDLDGGGGGGGSGSADAMKPEKEESGGGKLEPSAAFSVLDKIRGHKHGSVFERRLQIQKTEKYKKAVRRHVDLETIQRRIDAGSYSSCPEKFNVDLLLLFSNAIVFFPKSSSQSVAAQELRQIVMKEMKKKKKKNDNNSDKASSSSSEPRQTEVKLDDKPDRSDSLHPRIKPANHPIVLVSRKRSSISSAKPSTSRTAEKAEKRTENDKPVDDSKPVKSPPLVNSNEAEDSPELRVKEKPVTGTRSMRRGSQNRTNLGSKTEPSSKVSSVKSSNTPQQQHGTKDKGDNKKKSEAAVSTKKSSAADFLKRMKKNSPSKGTVAEAASKNSKYNNSKGGKKDQQRKKKPDEGKDGPARRGGGAGGKRQTKEENSPSKRNTGRPATRKGKEVAVTGKKKRGRDGDGEGSSQRAKKRSR